MTKERLGEFIAQQRRMQNMTQKDLAQQLHVTDKAVSKWERGLSYPDVTLLEPLSAALGLGIYVIYDNTNDTIEPTYVDEIPEEFKDQLICIWER